MCISTETVMYKNRFWIYSICMYACVKPSSSYIMYVYIYFNVYKLFRTHRWMTLQWWGKPMKKPYALRWSRVHGVINVLVLVSHAIILSSGNSHVALTLLCRSSGSNSTKPQQTFKLSPPMAAGAAKVCMFISLYCNVHHHINIRSKCLYVL